MGGMQTLQAKAQRFAGELAAEESAQPCSMRPEDTAVTLSPALRAKAEQAAAALTPDELVEVSLLVQRAGSTGDDDDSVGHMFAELAGSGRLAVAR